jgi:DNA-binding transcriptional LysR family regulator
VTGRAAPTSCVARPLAATRFGLYASAAFLKAHGTLDHPHELRPEHCMAVATGQQQMTWTLQQAHSGDCATVSVRSAWRTNCPGALMAAALEGAGIAIAPVHLAQTYVAHGDLVRLLDDWDPAPLDTYLLYRTRRNQPLRVRKLIECIVQALGEAPTRAIANERLALCAA